MIGKLLAPFMPYIAGGLLALAGALAVALWWQSGRVDALIAENASLSRSVAALERSIERSKLARAVADANAARERERAEEYDRLRESLLRGEEDAELPDWFRRYLDDLLGRVRPDD